MAEKFKDIEGYEGYYMVSDMGNVKSLRRKKPNVPNAFIREKILIPDKTGFVQLYKNNTSKIFHVGRLVANAFVSNPNNYGFVGYKNKNCMDWIATNIEWIEKRFTNSSNLFNIYGKSS